MEDLEELAEQLSKEDTEESEADLLFFLYVCFNNTSIFSFLNLRYY
jgi:hypothetical protein